MSSVTTNEARPNKRRRTEYTGEVVTVTLKSSKKVSVHKNIICQSSEFFKKACSETWRGVDADPISIDLAKATKGSTFLSYVDWLYIARLDFSDENQSPDSSAADLRETLNTKAWKIMRLYILGDYIQDVRFRNRLIGEFLALLGGLSEALQRRGRDLAPEFVGQWWPRLPAKCGMARLLVSLYECYGNSEVIDDLPTDFVARVAQACMRHRGLSLEDCKPDNQPHGFYYDEPSPIEQEE